MNATVPLFGDDGACLDPKVAEQLDIVGQQVMEFALWRRAGLVA